MDVRLCLFAIVVGLMLFIAIVYEIGHARDVKRRRIAEKAEDEYLAWKKERGL